MDDVTSPLDLSAFLKTLQRRDKEPNSARVLNSWIAQAERKAGSESGRLGWLIASTVVTAKLQKVSQADQTPYFLLKGGTLLQHRLTHFSRATRDLDGMVRADLDTFISLLDSELAYDWGPFSFTRGSVSLINVPYLEVKPRRFTISLFLNGVIWRTINVEISPSEGGVGEDIESFLAPDIAGFGIIGPEQLSGIPLSYQIAQKVHAVTDPHNPPASRNDRVRDVIDLVLLKELIEMLGAPHLGDVADSIQETFIFRAMGSRKAGMTARTWPATIQAYPHWEVEFERTAREINFPYSLSESIQLLNSWLLGIQRKK